MSVAVRSSPRIVARRIVRVRGTVQGVGFRPFVWRLARELALSGWVRNDAQGVIIEVQGRRAALDRFIARLRQDAPDRSRIDRIETHDAAIESADGFVIRPSEPGDARTGIPSDTAVCGACLEELFDPADRRYRYPFINCTDCGPRFTITQALPYDRKNTSMAKFALCPPCATEYGDPADRRFHAQPNACADCGPSLVLADRDGTYLDERDVIAATLVRLRRGEIVAIKGLGGFHLACDARNAEAVARLRARKSREEKPFAVMVAGVGSLSDLAISDAAERVQLESRERPIVLLRKTAACDRQLPGVAPGIARLGAMRPAPLPSRHRASVHVPTHRVQRRSRSPSLPFGPARFGNHPFQVDLDGLAVRQRQSAESLPNPLGVAGEDLAPEAFQILVQLVSLATRA